MASNDLFALSNAILNAVGIDPSTVRKVTFEHDVLDAPVLTIERFVFNADTHAFDTFAEEWVPKASVTA